MAPGLLPVKRGTLCRNTASGIRRFQALLPPSKCLHLSELYLLCKAGTVMAHPRGLLGADGQNLSRQSRCTVTPEKDQLSLVPQRHPLLMAHSLRLPCPQYLTYLCTLNT